jgi:hypothetical protein
MVLTGAGITMANGLQMARIGDLVLGYCGHVSVVITGSGNVITEGSPQARISDMFSGPYQGMIISGSPNVGAG